MHKLPSFVGTSCILLALTLAVRGDEGDDKVCRAIVDKAIKVHGGAANLKKAKASHVKASGTLDFMNGLKFTSETFAQDPDKFKNVIELNINNMNINVTVVFNGKNFWINAGGNETEFKDAKDLAEMKENMYLEQLGTLVPLREKSITLSPLGEAKVNDKDAVGIRAASKGHRDLNLYFDKKSGLLVKTEARIFDFQNKQEVTQEKIYSDYKKDDGIMTPRRIVINQDGKRHITLEITSAAYSESHDASLFAKP